MKKELLKIRASFFRHDLLGQVPQPSVCFFWNKGHLQSVAVQLCLEEDCSSPPFRHPGWQADIGSNIKHAPPKTDPQKKKSSSSSTTFLTLPTLRLPGCRTEASLAWFFLNESPLFYPEGPDRIIFFNENQRTAELAQKRIGWQIQIQPIKNPIILEQKGEMPKSPSF